MEADVTSAFLSGGGSFELALPWFDDQHAHMHSSFTVTSTLLSTMKALFHSLFKLTSRRIYGTDLS